MRSVIIEKDGIVGFGLNREEAISDWTLNSYIKGDMSIDDTEYASRRDVISPWIPLPNMLHLSTIGCIQYIDGSLVNIITGKSVPVISYDYSLFYYLSVIFGTSMSFEDITVVCRDKINEFFYNISHEFKPIELYPTIKLSNEFTGFNPTVSFVTDNDIIFGYDGVEVGLKKSADNEDYFYSVQYDKKEQVIPLLSYIGYKIGVVVNEKEVYPI